MALTALALVANVACSAEQGSDTAAVSSIAGTPFVPIEASPPAVVPTGPTALEVASVIDLLVADPFTRAPGALDQVSATADPRLAWVLVDLLRISKGRTDEAALVAAITSLLSAAPSDGQDPWVSYSDLLLRWDIPAPDEYAAWKRSLLVSVDPAWAPFLDGISDSSGIDWRALTTDDVPRDGVEVLTSPAWVTGAEAAWLPDDDRVAGVVVGSEVRAYPLRVLASHEVVNDTVADEQVAAVHDPSSGLLAIYRVPAGVSGAAPAELHVSGLSQRGVDLLYDAQTESLVDPLTRAGCTGPGGGGSGGRGRMPFTLTTWGEWRQAHPDSSLVSEDGGVGRVYLTEPYVDVAVPVRAVGAADQRLGAGARVVGVVGPDGTEVAFPPELVELALLRGEEVAVGEVSLVLEAGGLVAKAGDDRIGSIMATWADWSRLHPTTLLWE